ncbi:hypothetical protein Tco_0038948 [Tanacetum coccineum]
MGDENPIRTIGDYSKPSHDSYRNTIELLVGNNVVPLRSDTIRLVLNGCSFHGLRSEDPNQHLKDFLKLVDSLDFDGANRERTRLRLITKVPHHGIDLWLKFQIFYDHVNPVTRRTIDQSAGGKLRDRNAKESWALLEDLALYDNESWNDPRDFAKPVKAITLPQDVPSTSDRHLIEIENQVQRLMEDHLAPDANYQVKQSHYLMSLLNAKKCEDGPQLLWGARRGGRAFCNQGQSRFEQQMSHVFVSGLYSFNSVLWDNVVGGSVGIGRCDENELERRGDANSCCIRVIAFAGMWRMDKWELEVVESKERSKVRGAQTPYYARKDFLDCYLPGEWETTRDVELNPFKDVLVFRRMVEFLGSIPITLKSNM